ncbi:MAG: class I SAM-dependent methyltransferase [Pseudomonadota bacterium]
MTDQQTLEVYANRIADYAKTFKRNRPDRSLRHFMAALPAGGHVHDLGCGTGQAAAMMRDAGFIVTASDACPKMVQYARDHYDLDATVGTFDQLKATAAYDGIWANFSLLHAPRTALPHHIKAIKKALRPDGIFHLGLKIGTGEQRDALGRFYSYHSVAELQKILADNAFEILEMAEGSEKGLAGTQDPFVIILSRG